MLTRDISLESPCSFQHHRQEEAERIRRDEGDLGSASPALLGKLMGTKLFFRRLDVDGQRFRAPDDDFVTLLNFV